MVLYQGNLGPENIQSLALYLYGIILEAPASAGCCLYNGRKMVVL